MPDWNSRSRIARSILDVAGLTPMVELQRVTDGIDTRIAGKLEFFNPSQSVKDRILPFMVEEAERRGDLKVGMSEERKKSILAYGAELILTPGGESDVDLTLEKVEELKVASPGKFWEAG